MAEAQKTDMRKQMNDEMVGFFSVANFKNQVFNLNTSSALNISQAKIANEHVKKSQKLLSSMAFYTTAPMFENTRTEIEAGKYGPEIKANYMETIRFFESDPDLKKYLEATKGYFKTSTISDLGNWAKEFGLDMTPFYGTYRMYKSWDADTWYEKWGKYILTGVFLVSDISLVGGIIERGAAKGTVAVARAVKTASAKSLERRAGEHILMEQASRSEGRALATMEGGQILAKLGSEEDLRTAMRLKNFKGDYGIVLKDGTVVSNVERAGKGYKGILVDEKTVAARLKTIGEETKAFTKKIESAEEELRRLVYSTPDAHVLRAKAVEEDIRKAATDRIREEATRRQKSALKKTKDFVLPSTANEKDILVDIRQTLEKGKLYGRNIAEDEKAALKFLEQKYSKTIEIADLRKGLDEARAHSEAVERAMVQSTTGKEVSFTYEQVNYLRGALRSPLGEYSIRLNKKIYDVAARMARWGEAVSTQEAVNRIMKTGAYERGMEKGVARRGMSVKVPMTGRRGLKATAEISAPGLVAKPVISYTEVQNYEERTNKMLDALRKTDARKAEQYEEALKDIPGWQKKYRFLKERGLLESSGGAPPKIVNVTQEDYQKAASELEVNWDAPAVKATGVTSAMAKTPQEMFYLKAYLIDQIVPKGKVPNVKLDRELVRLGEPREHAVSEGARIVAETLQQAQQAPQVQVVERGDKSNAPKAGGKKGGKLGSGDL